MGNAGSNVRDAHRQKSSDTAPPSPTKDGQAFVFDKQTKPLVFQSSNEDDDSCSSTKYSDDELGAPRQRAATVSEGTTKLNDAVIPTVFKWEGGGKNVCISGSFSNWKTLPMVKSHGDFVTIIDLPEGEHQYKFYVDGHWRHDPGVKIIDNGMGSKNNLCLVKKSDFEVFQALAMDSESTGDNVHREYSQVVPASKPWEKSSGPPNLPPHLLQVILNKDTPLSCEPTLLPEPNHVMLNHLYALSIKEGVMVLSATHRYRKNDKNLSYSSVKAHRITATKRKGKRSGPLKERAKDKGSLSPLENQKMHDGLVSRICGHMKRRQILIHKSKEVPTPKRKL